MLRQQISGIINLSFPLIIVYAIYPPFLLTLPGQIACATALGFYVWYLSYKGLIQLTKTLQFIPTGDHKDEFEGLIKSCNLETSTIILKYAYTNESIAMAAINTVIIDPITWHGLSDDPQAIKVEEIFKMHIEPNLTVLQKERIASIHELLTLPAQRFLFKHELGHVVHNFSYKKLAIIFSIGSLAAYSGIIAAVYALQIHGLLAILVGMFVGGSVDLFLTYVSNILFKLQEEKAADRFAAKYSSDEEIQAAAYFFEQHQYILDKGKEMNSLLSFVPASIFTGYQTGSDRSACLLQLMSKNKK